MKGYAQKERSRCGKMGKIFYLMGKSASGKDTIYKELKERCKELKTVALYTTRPIREGEKDGEEYYFVDRTRFEELLKSGKVIEYRDYHTVHGLWTYFTVDCDQFLLDQESYLMIGTLESYEKMQKYFGKDVMIPLYIQVEDGERLARALARERQQEHPKYAEMCRRFLTDSEDFAEEKLQALGIDTRYENHNVQDTVNEILKKIQKMQ